MAGLFLAVEKGMVWLEVSTNNKQRYGKPSEQRRGTELICAMLYVMKENKYQFNGFKIGTGRDS